jgi:hypothetical protein
MDESLTPGAVLLAAEIDAFLAKVEMLAARYMDEVIGRGITEFDLDDCRRLACFTIGSAITP